MAFLLALAVACVLVFLTARGASGQAGEGEVDEDSGGAPYVAGELIVTYEEEISEAPVEGVAEEVEGEIEESLPAVDAQLLDFPEVKAEGSREEREQVLEEKKEELEEDPAVEAVDYNYLRELAARPNDPRFDEQWHLRKVAAPVAWDTENGGGGTRIGVIDSGIDLDHPDLSGKIADSINTANPKLNANDTNSHGTHVAGVAAAATNNDRGVAGACPECELLIAKAEPKNNPGNVTAAAATAGIIWATNNGADVINMSYSVLAPLGTAERESLNRASDRGVTLVAAAGNQDTKTKAYPAAYENVIGVAATTRQDKRAGYSNFGAWIDVSAPGGSGSRSTSILSTVPGGYGYKNGTSMSSPVVAGVAGLLSSQGLSKTAIRERIESTATDLGPRGKDDSFGDGRVDAAAAVGDLERNSYPTISDVRPKPGAKPRSNRVRITAAVRDRQGDLAKRNIALVVDGRRVAFKYNPSNGRLVREIQVARGGHKVRIVARDDRGLAASKIWRFSTGRR